jgi:hypothetical protein
MGLKYLIRKHVKEGMMMQMLQNVILKMNYLLFDKFFKKKETRLCLRAVEDHMLP